MSAFLVEICDAETRGCDFDEDLVTLEGGLCGGRLLNALFGAAVDFEGWHYENRNTTSSWKQSGVSLELVKTGWALIAMNQLPDFPDSLNTYPFLNNLNPQDMAKS